MQPNTVTPNNTPTPAAVPPSQAPRSGWQFTAQEEQSVAPTASTIGDPVQWSASEFISHDKSAGWYIGLAVATVIGGAGIFLLTNDVITAGAVVVAAIFLGIIAARKPQEQQYVVDEHGIQVGKKMYSYAKFKSFSIVQEGGVESIWLMPMERFKPGLSIYFAPDDSQKIIDALSAFLPVEDHQPDPIDKLMHRIRF